MNWHARLAERRGTIFPKAAGDSLTKLPKVTSVSFVSDPDGHSEKIASTDVPGLRSRLLALAVAEHIDAAHVHRMDAVDMAACGELSDDTLRAYLRALDRGTVMKRGIAPAEYTQAAHCAGCGPVWLWQGAPARVLACPWCFRRKAGKALPRPKVTCGDCIHYLPDPLNPQAGAGGCGAGTGRARWPMARHLCDAHAPTDPNDGGEPA